MLTTADQESSADDTTRRGCETREEEEKSFLELGIPSTVNTTKSSTVPLPTESDPQGGICVNSQEIPHEKRFHVI